MKACFVTGTDTEIGKTLVSAALLHVLAGQGARSLGMKPIASGAESIGGRLRNPDVQALALHSSVRADPDLLTPYLFREPAAPHILAAKAGEILDPLRIQSNFQAASKLADYVVVEGVGGFMVPLGAGQTGADLAQRLNLPVILVVGLRLGALNHALLSAQAIRASGLTLLGWVSNQVEENMLHAQANIQSLREYLPEPCLGIIPRLHNPDPNERIRLAALHLRHPWPA
ncbi:dethiobiotin synthase [Alcaligenes sp. SDU_A2]|uniref:dethiobiotin synthase n=1 Tax=Alcaligenes sp. SDU_A2 TaxID=3136634 RepID=UPI00311D8659